MKKADGEEISGDDSDEAAVGAVAAVKLTAREAIHKFAEDTILRIEDCVGLHMGSRQALADLCIDHVKDLDKDHSKALSEKCAKIYMHPKGDEDLDRGANIKERLEQLTPIVFVLKKVAEFIESITGDIDDETQFDIGPEVLAVLRDVVTGAGCDYKECDFVGLCMERQSDILCYSHQFVIFVKTMDKDLAEPMSSRFTIGQIDSSIREEFQTTILKKVIGDLAMAPDNEDSLRDLMDAIIFSKCVISSDMKGAYLRNVHALCASDEHDDDEIYKALTSIKTALHPFCHPFTKVYFLLPCAKSCKVCACLDIFDCF
jgi:hypothetical protein